MTESERGEHKFVVMAHGDSPFLAGCLASLQAQTTPAKIVITTSTPSAHIEEAAWRIGAPVMANPRREGIAADWNFALATTEARYITLAHQDDVYFPRFLERSLNLLALSTHAAVAFTGYEEINDQGAPVHSRISFAKHRLERLTLGAAAEPGPARMRAFLSFGNPLPCSSVTFDRDRLGDFRFSNAFRSNLDWDAWLRLGKSGAAFTRTPDRLVGRRHNSLTATAALTRDGVRQSEDTEIFRRLWPRPLADLIGFAYRAGYR